MIFLGHPISTHACQTLHHKAQHHEAYHAHPPRRCSRHSPRRSPPTTPLYPSLPLCLPLPSPLTTQPPDLFPALAGTADWSSVRTTSNHYSNGPVTDVTSASIRCYELSPGTGAATTTPVAAGSSVSFKVTPNIFHQGPLQFYMARVPAGKTAATWDGAGSVWFKIYAEKASVSSGGALSWASINAGTASVTIPRATPSGEYLLRIEHIALHSASVINGAQIYLSCAQIKVTGGGSG